MRTSLLLALAASATTPARLTAQAPDSAPIAKAVSALSLRSIGPASWAAASPTSRCIPRDRGTWYVAVGSGGVWKTTNAGVTWTPVFDDQPSYSIGVVTLDPTNPEVVWVGTGRERERPPRGLGRRRRTGAATAGRTWQRMGLAALRAHRQDPRRSPRRRRGARRRRGTALVGGRRARRLPDHRRRRDLDAGAPDRREHRRHRPRVRSGEPRRGLRRRLPAPPPRLGLPGRRPEARGSTSPPTAARPGGRSRTGLPKGDMGKIGLAVTPADPDLVYATIEADDEERGFYRSRDRGESWEKRNDYISGGTGPHYYQEIEASPTDPDLVYQMDVFIHVTRDGGATFEHPRDRPRQAQRQPRALDRLRRTAGTCSSAPTPGSTRASTTARPGATSRTCRSRSSTRWRSATASRSTTSSAARRTWARCTARRAR